MSIHEPSVSGDPNYGRVFVGAFVMAFGLGLLVDRADLWDLNLSGHLWPFVVLGIGLAKVTSAAPDAIDRRRAQHLGAWLTFVGVWGVVSEYQIWGLGYSRSWPLLIVGQGLMIVWRAAATPRGCGPAVRQETRP
jgi:hypothetical protein